MRNEIADITFFKDILSDSLRDSDFCFKVCGSSLKPDHFPRTYMKFVYRILKNYINNPKYKGKIPTLAVFKDKLSLDKSINDEFKESYYAKIRDLFTRKVQNSDYGFEAVEKLIVKREMKLILEDAITNISSSEDPKKEVETLVNKTFKISESDDIQIVDLFATSKDRQKLRLEMKSNPTKFKRFKFGIPSVDRCLPGGMMQGMMGSIAAKTGIGKSVSVVGLGARGPKQRLNVTHIGSENDNFQTTGRYDSNITKLKYDDIQLSKLSAEDSKVYERTFRKLNRKNKHKIMIAKCKPNRFNCATILQIINKLEIKHNHKTDLLIVDSPDLMQSVQNIKDIRLQQKAIYWELKELTDQKKLITLVTTQLTKAAKDEDPTAEDLSESYDKSRLLDILLVISQTKTQKANREATLAFVKNRDGARPENYATIVLQFDKMSFYEKPPEIEDEDKDEQDTIVDKKKNFKVIEGGKSKDNMDSLRKISNKKIKLPTKGIKKIKKDEK